MIYRDNGIQRRLQDGCLACLGPSDLFITLPAFNKLPDLDADGAHHPQQIFIGLANLRTKKLDHAMNVGAKSNWEPKCSVQAFLRRDGCAWEIGVVNHVGYPGRFT